MTKCQRFMLSVTVFCKGHGHFIVTCSACWLALQDYARSNCDAAVRDMLKYVTGLDEPKWHPWMDVGHMETGPSGGG